VSWNSITIVTPSTLVTDVDNSNLDHSTSLYPNPTQGIVSLKIDNEAQGLHTIAVYDVAGKKLSTTQVSKTSHPLEVPINLTELPSGVYYLETINANSRSFKKVAKY
jgi:hypothetical protein